MAKRSGVPSISGSAAAPKAAAVLQRACACGQHTGGGECAECKQQRAGELLRAAVGAGPQLAPPVVHEVLRGSGQPLDPQARALMEPRFGRDFSRVRVHTDARAAESARAVSALAYTVGQQIVFGAGRYAPNTSAGRRLLAHELTHTVQQGSQPAGQTQLRVGAAHDPAEDEASQIPRALDQPGLLPPISAQPGGVLTRAPLDVDGIAADSQSLATAGVQIGVAPIRPMAVLFFKYNGHAAGEIAKAADYPTTFSVPTDTTKPVPKPPKADAQPPLSNIPVEAHFFPTLWPAKGRALVVGGFHGDEHPGWQVADALVNELSQPSGGVGLAFNTIVVPRLNAGAIADELAGVRLWRNRCNRQLVDLNRNFPTGDKPRDTDCVNTDGAPIQPEVRALMDLITKFKPDRIVSMHAISTPASAGIFADPNQDPQAVALARGMASTVVNPSDRPANRLGAGPQSFNPVYPGDRPGVVGAGTSLGAWAPTAVPGQTTPVITMEAPGFKPLGSGPGTDPRTVAGFMRPIQAFLGDPADLATAADRDILSDIDALTAGERVAFLTGRLPKKNDLFRRIKLRIDTAIGQLNAMKPPTALVAASELRLFSEDVDGGSAQAKIDFEKFFLVGSRAGGWDTLPDQFFKNGKRSAGVDRAKWLATPSKERFEIILKFSSLPGTSRHHWGTEVDFNSTEVRDWQPATPSSPAGKLFALGQWLQTNAPKVGLRQSYTAGRSGGYDEEPWHYSYAPIARGLRERYNAQVNLQQDVIDKIVADFAQRAQKAQQQMPADFAQALKQIDISGLVNTIGPDL